MSGRQQTVKQTLSAGWTPEPRWRKKGQEGEWIQIEYEGQTAYVHSSLLE